MRRKGYDIYKTIKHEGKWYAVKGNIDDESFIGQEVMQPGQQPGETILIPREMVLKKRHSPTFIR